MNQPIKGLLKNPVSWIFILIFGIYTAMYLLTPLQNDDLSFIWQWTECGHGDPSFSFETWSNFFWHIRNGDNSRLSNILFPLFGMFSPWKEIFPFLASATICTMMWFVNKFAFSRGLDSWRLVAIWFVMVLFIPWRAHLFEVDYALNYILSSVVTLLNIFLLLHYEKVGWGKLPYILTLLTCILAGAWHEGFAAPTLAGLGMLTLTRRFKCSWQWYTLIGIYVVAAAVFGLSNGMIARFHREVETPRQDLLRTVADLSMCAIVVGSVLFFAIFRKGREQLRSCFANSGFIVFFTAMIVGGTISLGVKHSAMTSVYPQLTAIICFFSLYRPIVLAIGRKLRTVLTSICLLLILGQSAATLRWDWRFYVQDREIREQLEKSDTGTVFHDVIMPWEVPGVTTLYFPSRISYAIAFQIRSIDGLTPDKNFALVPAALQHIDLDKATPLGNDIYRYNNRIITTRPAPGTREMFLDVTLDDGTPLDGVYALIQEFKTLDGESFTYIQFLHPDAWRVKGITGGVECYNP